MQTTVDDAAAIVAVTQSLVAWLGARHDAGEALPMHETSRIAENVWSALRFGLTGSLLDPDHGGPEPTRERLARLLDTLEPTAASLGCPHDLVHARSLVAGNGAERQRYVAEREGIEGLVRWLVRETDPRRAA